MDKRDLALLERIFSDDVGYALSSAGGPQMPTQIKGKRIEELERQGYVKRVETHLGGRFPIVVKGWALTLLGHATYCFSCDEPDPRND